MTSVKKAVTIELGVGSEDSDFVALRARRESKKAESLKKVELDRTQPMNRQCSIKPVPDETITATLRLFDEAATAETQEFENLLYGAKRLDLVHPELDRNILLHVLHIGRVDLARLIVWRANVTLLMQDCNVSVGSLKGKKNVLHYVTELKEVYLAEDILSKFSEEDQKVELLMQETPVPMEDQRPRTLPCSHLAAFLGCRDLVVLYLSHGVKVDAVSSKKDTALFWAVRWNHLDIVGELLSRGANFNLENDRGSTPLYWAVRYGHTDCVRLLIGAGAGAADISKVRKSGLVSPVVLACALGYLPIVKLLIEAGADPNVCVRSKERPIHHAAREGYYEIIDYLLWKGARIDEQDEAGDTALLRAARSGHARCLQLLLAKGADPTVRNHMGEDLLSLAVKNDNNQILKTVLQAANDRRFARGSRSPLLLAAATGQVEKISTLLSMGLDPLTTDNEGNTMIHCAAIENQHNVIQKFHGQVNTDIQNNKGNTALHEACARGHAESVTELINCRTTAGIRNQCGETALHLAAYSRTIQPGTVKKLIDYIIKTKAWESLKIKDNDGNNALHVAAKFAKPEVIWEYRPLPLKVKNAKGNIALHAAVRKNEPDVLTTMLDIYETMKEDADVNEQNNEKETILHLVAKEGFDEHIARLVLFGADLSIKDAEGNTVLHTLTKLSAMHPQNAKTYLNVFQTILEQATMWWCMKHNKQFPQGESAQDAYARRAALHLLTEVCNNTDSNVIAMACQTGATDIIELIMSRRGVMCYQIDNRILYNVTSMTPLTNNAITGCFSKGKTVLRTSYIERLLSLENPAIACKVLDVQPFRSIEKAYCSVAAKTYLIIFVLHIIYVSLLSYSGIELLRKRLDEPKDDNLDAATVILYVIVPIEPLLVLLYTLYTLFKMAYSGQLKAAFKLKQTYSPGKTWKALYITFYLVSGFIYAVLVIVWVIMYKLRRYDMDFVFATAVCIGWLYTIAFIRGFRTINYFWKMIQHMTVRDVFQCLFFFFFFVVSFSIAYHGVFMTSEYTASFYPTLMDSIFFVFNFIVRMEDVYPDAFNFQGPLARHGKTTVYYKVLYSVGMMIGFVLMVNILNVMTSDSYSAILQQQRNNWRMESIQLGVSLEKTFPFTFRFFSSFPFKKNPPQFLTQHFKRPSLFQVSYSKNSDDELSIVDQRRRDVWCISVPQSRVREVNIYDIETEREVLREMKLKMASMEHRVTADLQQVKHDLNEFRSFLKDLQYAHSK